MVASIPSYAGFLALSNKPATQVTDADATALLTALTADPRVHSARWLDDRRLVEIDANNFRSGPMQGAFSVGRVIGEASHTVKSWADFLAAKQAQHDASAAQCAEESQRMSEFQERNRASLKGAGFDVSEVLTCVNRMFAGIYVGDDDCRQVRALDAHNSLVSAHNASRAGREDWIGNCDLTAFYGCKRAFQ
jgi:hypothetical protein